jgi:hypothetical protein
LVPFSAFGVGGQIDVEQAYAAQNSLRPMGITGFSSRINFDGFVNLHTSSDGNYWSYTQVFRNGAIEAIRIGVRKQDIIPAQSLGDWVFEVLPMYMSALRDLDVPPPIALMITLLDVRGARLGLNPHFFGNAAGIDRPALELPEIMIEDYGDDLEYEKASRPAFDALWNSAGYARSQYFDESGRWNPNRLRAERL